MNIGTQPLLSADQTGIGQALLRCRAHSVALIEGAHRLRFLYLDRKGEHDRWLPQWPDPMRLPALIALEIAVRTRASAAKRTIRSHGAR